MELLTPIDTTGLAEGAATPDLSMWDAAVPKASLDIENDRYFWYHHTHGEGEGKMGYFCTEEND